MVCTGRPGRWPSTCPSCDCRGRLLWFSRTCSGSGHWDFRRQQALESNLEPAAISCDWDWSGGAKSEIPYELIWVSSPTIRQFPWSSGFTPGGVL